MNRAQETEAANAESTSRAPQGRERFARERFRTIFRRALILTALLLIAVFVGIVALFIAGSSNPPSWAGLVIWVAVFIGLNVAWFVNWRCPVCGAYLGGGFWGFFSVRNCLRCGSKLE